MRLLIFFGALALLWLLGLRDRDEQILLLVLAAIISMVISFFALKPLREDYSRQLSERLERRAQARRSTPADEAAEDAEDTEDQATDGSDGPVEYR